MWCFDSNPVAAVQLVDRAQFVRSDRHNFIVFYLPYCDELARDLDAVPTFGRLCGRVFTSNPVRALSVLNAVYMEMASASQYRLFGKDSQPDLAAATTLRVGKRGKCLSMPEKAWVQSLLGKTEAKGEATARASA